METGVEVDSLQQAHPAWRWLAQWNCPKATEQAAPQLSSWASPAAGGWLSGSRWDGLRQPSAPVSGKDFQSAFLGRTHQKRRSEGGYGGGVAVVLESWDPKAPYLSGQAHRDSLSYT